MVLASSISVVLASGIVKRMKTFPPSTDSAISLKAAAATPTVRPSTGGSASSIERERPADMHKKSPRKAQRNVCQRF
jgi:hypothetical protein